MAAQVTNYQCPSCTGPLHFDSQTGKLKCDFCGQAFDVEMIEALYAEKDERAAVQMEQEEKAAQEKRQEMSGSAESEWDFSQISSDWGAEAEGLKTYSCPSCGAELLCEETTAATSCPYCSNPTIIPGKFSGGLKPDVIIPFKVDREAAVKALQEHYKGKFLLPKVFSQQNHIEEVKGIYVPFWLYSGRAHGSATYDATRSHSHQSGNTRVTVTERYVVERAGVMDFEKIPVDGLKKMADGYMDAIEPYDYRELKPFSTAYLPGYLADKYDVSAEEGSVRADERASSSTIQAMKATVKGYGTCSAVHQHVALERRAVQYALLPVWILNTKWEGQDYLFAMNGQTGKLIGDLPISKSRFWGLFGTTFAVAAAIVSLIFWM